MTVLFEPSPRDSGRFSPSDAAEATTGSITGTLTMQVEASMANAIHNHFEQIKQRTKE